MDEDLIRLLVIIGLPFCFAAGLAAFLTTYAGYTRGQNPDKRLAMRMAFKIALVTIMLFTILIAGIGIILSKIL